MTAAIAGPGTVRGIVFDMDDTLYPEMQFVEGGLAAAATAAAERFGVPCAEFLARMKAALGDDLARFGRARTVFNAALVESGIADDPQTIAWLVSAYRTHQPMLEPFPDVRPTLAALTAQTELALITDGPAAVQRAKYESLHLDEFFAAAIFTDEHGPDAGKPSETSFVLVEELTGLPGASLVYVGDNPRKDFVGARQLGWKTVRVRRPSGLHSRLEAAEGFGADAEVASLLELPSLLGLPIE